MLVRFIIVVICVLLASCATGHYSNTNADQYATFILRSDSRDSPVVEIVVGGETYSIPAGAVVKPYANVKTEQLYKVAAQEEVLIKFTHHWIGDELSYPRTHSSGGIELIKIEKAKSVESCETSVSLIPKLGQHYDVYFKYSMGQCHSWVQKA